MTRARLLPLLLALTWAIPAAPAADISLPAFPRPPLAPAAKSVGSVRLVRDLQRAGVRGWDILDAADGNYAVFRDDGLGGLAAWLETACKALDVDVAHARARSGGYDGAVFARLLNVATSLASLRDGTIDMAMPIGALFCEREAAWGELPADGKSDAYVLFITDAGMMVYDPPTRQLAKLADFPNRARVSKVSF